LSILYIKRENLIRKKKKKMKKNGIVGGGGDCARLKKMQYTYQLTKYLNI